MLTPVISKSPWLFFFSFFFFDVDHFFKVFIEFVTILLLFYVLVFWPRGIWDLSSSTRDRTLTPCTRRRILNPWTTREVPGLFDINSKMFLTSSSSLRHHSKSATPHLSLDLLKWVPNWSSCFFPAFFSKWFFSTQQLEWSLKSTNWILSLLCSEFFMISHWTEDKIQNP